MVIPIKVYVQGYLGWSKDNLAPCPTCCVASGETKLAIVNKLESLLFCPNCKSLHSAKIVNGGWHVSMHPEQYVLEIDR